MADIKFRSIGAALQGGLYEHMVQEEVRRRQAMLDKLTIDAEQRRAEEAKFERERQEWRDAIFGQDRQRQIANEERDYNDRQQRQRIEDERYTAGQQQRELDRADQQGQRYQDAERGYYEADQRRQFEAGEAAKDRASQERRAAASASRADTPKSPTQGQLAADTFYARATDALDEIEAVEDNVSRFNSYVPNFLQTDDGQAYEQAKRQWVEAYLRKDSGAAIGKDEYANADRTYFVQPGDSSATVQRKRRARQKMTDSIRTQGSGGSGPSDTNRSTTRSRYRVTVE